MLVCQHVVVLVLVVECEAAMMVICEIITHVAPISAYYINIYFKMKSDLYIPIYHVLKHVHSTNLRHTQSRITEIRTMVDKNYRGVYKSILG